jgi:hypothetical protein
MQLDFLMSAFAPHDTQSCYAFRGVYCYRLCFTSPVIHALRELHTSLFWGTGSGKTVLPRSQGGLNDANNVSSIVEQPKYHRSNIHKPSNLRRRKSRDQSQSHSTSMVDCRARRRAVPLYIIAKAERGQWYHQHRLSTRK